MNHDAKRGKKPGEDAFPRQRIAVVVKLACALFVAVLVPVYWDHFGPANFLWFSHLALLTTLLALWLESPILASMQAVAVLLPELGWIGSFLVRLVTGPTHHSWVEYMFAPEGPLLIRGLSLFHVVLPFLIVWLVGRLGYDRRALAAQTLVAWVLLPVCYFFTAPVRNLNWVFGPSETLPAALSPGAYLLLEMLLLPVCFYLPTHLLLRALLPSPEALRTGKQGVAITA